MQDTKLFETILGITTPWHVARVTLKPEDERVDVWLEHEPTRWPCPDCGETVPAFDHAAERTWRHLDTCQFQTHLHAKIPRVHARVRAPDRLNERVHKRLVGVAPEPLVPKAEIQRIGQAVRVVGSDVEHDRQRPMRWQPGTQCIETQLADWNTHSTNALVAEPEDPLPVGHDHHRRVFRAATGEDTVDRVALVVTDKEPASASVEVGEFLTGLAHNRRIHDRHHFLDVVVQEAKEECFITVVQTRQIDELLEIRRFALETVVGPVELLLNRGDGGRQQTVQVKFSSLTSGECGAFVGDRIQKQFLTRAIHRNVSFPGVRICLVRIPHPSLRSVRKGGRWAGPRVAAAQRAGRVSDG